MNVYPYDPHRLLRWLIDNLSVPGVERSPKQLQRHNGEETPDGERNRDKTIYEHVDRTSPLDKGAATQTAHSSR